MTSQGDECATKLLRLSDVLATNLRRRRFNEIYWLYFDQSATSDSSELFLDQSATSQRRRRFVVMLHPYDVAGRRIYDETATSLRRISTNLQRICDVAATSLRRNFDETATSLRRISTNLRRRCDVATTSLRRRYDVAATS